MSSWQNISTIFRNPTTWPYLSPDQSQTAVTCPPNSQTFTSQWYAGNAGLASDVPEATSTITRHGCQFSFFDGIPGHPFNCARVAAKLGAVLHLRLFGVPYPESTIGRSSGDQVAGGIPSNCAYTRSSMSRLRAIHIRTYQCNARMRARATSGGRVVISLSLQGSKQRGKSILWHRFTGSRRCHRHRNSTGLDIGKDKVGNNKVVEYLTGMLGLGALGRLK